MIHKQNDPSFMLHPDAVRSWQQFQGSRWLVLGRTAVGRYVRLDSAAATLASSLTIRRTLPDALERARELGADIEPEEAARVVSLLASHGLLLSDSPGDASAIVAHRRMREKRRRLGKVMSLLCVSLTLFNPERCLNAVLPMTRWIFGPVGFALWMLVVTTGLAALIASNTRLSETLSASVGGRAVLGYAVAFLCLKLFHEMAHGLACKSLGPRKTLPVTRCGVMLIGLLPIPFVDVSSSVTIRGKWRRMFVGAAGMYVEVFIAALAAIVWAFTVPGVVHVVAFQVLVLASVTTLLFNANPLARFDGYYILSDVLEIPNLDTRGRATLGALIRRYAFGCADAQSPADTRLERVILPLYAVAAIVYRVALILIIAWFVSQCIPGIGTPLALTALALWIAGPLTCLFNYLRKSTELAGRRLRAALVAAAAPIVIVGILALAPVADSATAMGVTWPRSLEFVHAPAAGFVSSLRATGSQVDGGDDPLLTLENHTLQIEALRAAELTVVAETEWRRALTGAPATASAREDDLAVRRGQQQRLNDLLAQQEVRATTEGVWMSNGLHIDEHVRGSRSEPLGIVAGVDRPVIRLIVDQTLGARIVESHQVGDAIRIFARNRLRSMEGTITYIAPAAHRRLEVEALSASFGGRLPVDRVSGLPLEQLTIVEIELLDDSINVAGQRVMAEFDFEPRPLLGQWLRSFRRALQSRSLAVG